jgi:hypothetical protein
MSHFSFFLLIFLWLGTKKWEIQGMIFPFSDPNGRENGNHMGILPKTQLEAVHLAKVYALKLVHQDNFEAFQL